METVKNYKTKRQRDREEGDALHALMTWMVIAAGGVFAVAWLITDNPVHAFFSICMFAITAVCNAQLRKEAGYE